MNYIYTNHRDNSRYILNPQITMGDKVCLINMSTCEDKFVSSKTLKRWYSRTTTEQPIVELQAFTGMKIGLFCAELALNTNTIYLWTKNNKLLTFDSHIGVQINAKNPKFANKIGSTYDFLKSTLEWAIS